jgi:hypothetical protein
LKNMQKGAVKAHFVILFQHMNEAKEGNPWDVSIGRGSQHVNRAEQHVHDCNVLKLNGDTYKTRTVTICKTYPYRDCVGLMERARRVCGKEKNTRERIYTIINCSQAEKWREGLQGIKFSSH